MRQLRRLEIVSGTENYPIFVMRENEDAKLIAEWNSKLTNLSKDCRHFCSILSIHLFRMGAAETSSTPTILINTSGLVDEYRRVQVQEIISSCLSIVFSPQIVFRQSRLRRSVNQPSTGLPPICQPRNRLFATKPGTGASIGIKGSLQDTATLGCYLLVDKKPMVLTVDHLIPSESQSAATITHLSEQDCHEMMTPVIERFVSMYACPPGHSCLFCVLLRGPNADTSHIVMHLRNMAGEEASCRLLQELSHFIADNESICGSLPIAKMVVKSGRRCRELMDSVWRSENRSREMDWALFEVLDDTKYDLKLHLTNEISRRGPEPPVGMPYLHHKDVRPGALVRSLGRTSGHQVGQINSTASMIFHETYATLEWCVIKRPETYLKDWVEGGIGVDGDSGSIIVDEQTNALYGMLWGRIGDGPTTVTLFTPISDILNDITEELENIPGNQGFHLDLLPGQEMPQPPSTRLERESPPSKVETAPIMLHVEESQGSLVIEETPTPGVRRLSSFETGHPHPLERYRRNSHYSSSRPTRKPKDEDLIQSSQFPGTYTYFRFGVAPEGE
jgi:hypothetical protein